VKKRQKREFLA